MRVTEVTVKAASSRLYYALWAQVFRAGLHLKSLSWSSSHRLDISYQLPNLRMWEPRGRIFYEAPTIFRKFNRNSHINLKKTNKYFYLKACHIIKEESTFKLSLILLRFKKIKFSNTHI